MPTVDDVQFNTMGWDRHPDESDQRRAWTNAQGDVLSLRFTPGTPKMPSLFHMQALRDYYTHQVSAAGGAILSLELLQIRGVSVGKLIFKKPQAENGWGYLGSLVIAYKDFSYVLRLQAMESPGDETRAAFVWNQLVEGCPDQSLCLHKWFGRAEADHTGAVLPCLADEERWDIRFPEHALSRLRAEMNRLIPTIQVSREVKNSQPHRGNG